LSISRELALQIAEEMSSQDNLLFETKKNQVLDEGTGTSPSNMLKLRSMISHESEGYSTGVRRL